MVEDTLARRGANNNYILLENYDHFIVLQAFRKVPSELLQACGIHKILSARGE